MFICLQREDMTNSKFIEPPPNLPQASTCLCSDTSLRPFCDLFATFLRPQHTTRPILTPTWFILTLMWTSWCHLAPQCRLRAFIWCQLAPYWLHLGSPGFNFEANPRRILMVFMLACFSNVTQFSYVWDSCWPNLGSCWCHAGSSWAALDPCWGPLDPPWEHLGVVLGPIMDVMPSTLGHDVPPCCMFDLIWCQLGPYWLHLGSPSFNFEEKTRRILMVFVVACFSMLTLILACVLHFGST